MAYFIGPWRLRNTDGIPLSNERYEALETARRNVLELLAIEQKYDNLISNFFEMEADAVAVTTRHMLYDNKSSVISLRDEVSLLNRRVSNLLTSTRAYLDQTPHHLKSSSVGSGPSISFDRARSHYYDTNIEYRFMEAARNYVQHRGNLIKSISLKSSKDSTDENTTRSFTLELNAKTSDLREDGKFKTIILDEMEPLARDVNIKKMVRGYIECISRVHHDVRSTTADNISSSKDVIKDAILKARKDANLNENEIVFAWIENKDKTISSEIYISNEASEYHSYYLKKNKAPNLIARSYVSGA